MSPSLATIKGTTSGEMCSYTDAECKTTDEDTCATTLKMTTEACKAAGMSCTFSGCKGGCFTQTLNRPVLAAAGPIECATADDAGCTTTCSACKVLHEAGKAEDWCEPYGILDGYCEAKGESKSCQHLKGDWQDCASKWASWTPATTAAAWHHWTTTAATTTAMADGGVAAAAAAGMSTLVAVAFALLA